MIDEKILRSMASILNYVVCSIEESTTLYFDELQSNLLVQESRMNSHKGNDDEQALKMSYSRRGFGHGRGCAGARWRGRES